MRNILTYILLLICILTTIGCKNDFLDTKPRSSILTPNSLNELQGLMENDVILNKSTPALSQMASDDYVFTSYESWQSTNTPTERNSYVWAKDIYSGAKLVRDWSSGYAGIFYCNNVLAVLPKIEQTQANFAQHRMIRGWALFVRAYLLYDLVRNFSPTYDVNSADRDLGVPVPLKPEIDVLLPRSSLKNTYSQVISDLEQATRFLETTPSANSNRPNRTAAYALQARIYLSMREYVKAELYADSTLNLYNKLIDYNTISQTAASPFTVNNDETIFSSAAIFEDYPIIAPASTNTRITINPELIRLYEPNDLRKTVFFRANSTTGNLYMRRGYYMQTTPYTGLATDEIYLIKAECLARRSMISESLDWLNALLIKRFLTGSFKPVSGLSADAVLQRILTERRKELVWRTLRWTDLKRLNKEGANITLTRNLNGVTYTLPANDPRYIFPIPDYEIALSSIQQNPR